VEKEFMVRTLIRFSRRRAAAALLLALTVAPCSVAAQGKRQRQGTLVKLQSLDLGGYAMHLPHVLTPGQSLVRLRDYVITIGGTSGESESDHPESEPDPFEAARLYRIRANGTLAFVRHLPPHARALAVRGDTVYAVAFDGGTTTHLEALQLTGEKNEARVTLLRKPPLHYTTFMRWLTPLPDGIAVVEIPRPGHSSTDRIYLLSSDASKVLAVHLVKKDREPRGDPNDPVRDYTFLRETVLSLSTNDTILAARLTNGRIRLLDFGESKLTLRREMNVKGLLAITLSNQILYAYTEAGMIVAFDVSDPGNPAQLWARRIPKVPDPKGIVIDGERIIVHGIGLTEVWSNDAHPPVYYQVENKWKGLECVIVNGDRIYAFNGAASVSKLMVFRMKRP
jgi:hypothetical protein